MPPIAPSPNEAVQLVQSLRELQASFLEKAMNYSRLVVALGYGGFFAIWSGTRQLVSPRLEILSALLVLASATLFILFEVAEAAALSHLSVKLAKATTATGQLVPEHITDFHHSRTRVTHWFVRAWYPTFVISAVGGFGAAGLLAAGFVRSLIKLW
jgi:hypothetical protein